jgi:[acyl-carrier-protein] S-malonyltransferase
VSNVDAELLTHPDDLRSELVGHIVASVQWIRVVETLLANGATKFIEIGPGNVLSGLIRRVDKCATTMTAEQLLAPLLQQREVE